MKDVVEEIDWSPTRRIAFCFSCSLLVSLLFTAMATTFSTKAGEAAETCSTVVWYLKGGYWREDVKVYLTHPEYVFYL